MQLLTTRRPTRVVRTRTSRQMYPVVEGFEPRLLMSGATLGGIVQRDITGNGSSSDDAPLPNVTVNLFQKGSTTVLKSTTTDSKGAYSFTGLSAGSYSVQQVAPTNFLPTGGLGGYSVSLAGSQKVANENFDDFDSGLYSKSTVSDIKYTVTSPDGKTVTHPTTLGGNVPQGDTVNVHFLLSKPEVVELVAYVAPDAQSDSASLQKQVIFSQQESSTTASGYQTATVTVPNGYFQLDLVAGPAIDHLAANADTYYSAQDRLIASTLGGTQVNGKSTLSGSVDVTNASGQKVGLAGVKLILTGYDYTGKQVNVPVTTDADGNYTFTGLVASDPDGYRIVEDVPAGFKLVGGNKFITVFLNTNSASTRDNFLDESSNG